MVFSIGFVFDRTSPLTIRAVIAVVVAVVVVVVTSPTDLDAVVQYSALDYFLIEWVGSISHVGARFGVGFRKWQ